MDYRLQEKWENALPVQPGWGASPEVGLCPAARPAHCTLPPPSPHPACWLLALSNRSPGNNAHCAGLGLCTLFQEGPVPAAGR